MTAAGLLSDAMRFNPFRPGKIAGPDMFAGRVEEVLELTRILIQAKEGNAQHFLISGERGIGKSSLMLFLKELACGSVPFDEKRFKFIVVEAEIEANYTYVDIVKQLASALNKALAPHQKAKEVAKAIWGFVKNIEAAGVKYGGSRATPENYEVLDQLVTAVIDATKVLSDEIDGILILIDEADKATPSAGLGAMVKIFTDRLAKQACDNVCLGLAGVTGVIPKLRASHESAPRIFTVFGLKPLEDAEREQVVNNGLNRANAKNETQTSISREALKLICSLSEGFPHFIQEFAYFAFAEDTDGNIDVDDFLAGATKENGALDQLGEKYFQQMYYGQGGTDEYRQVLRAMAQRGGDGWTTKKEIREATGLKETTLGNAIYTLKDRQVIQAKLGEKGVYRLPSLSFAAWIRARTAGENLEKPTARPPG